MPKIIEIRKCLFKLQLKMSGVFFSWDTVYGTISWKWPAAVKYKLFHSYCSRFYGSELWDLNDCRINNVCALWRKGLRRARSLPYNTHSECLPILCDSLSVFDVLCKRSLSFMHTCITSDCHIVKNISRYALEHGCMFPLLVAMLCSVVYTLVISLV